MSLNKFLVITSIMEPGAVMKMLAEGAKNNDCSMIVIGDRKSPEDYVLNGADYYDIKRQQDLDFSFSNICPVDHYARKNIGYLIAFRRGASEIIETDDDNYPYPEFWDAGVSEMVCHILSGADHINVYKNFTDKNIWPRGFPLNYINQSAQISSNTQKVKTPIVQCLADNNPDVDAIYRLTGDLPVTFDKSHAVALRRGSFCPFNSQNTTWQKPAFLLMYLPSFCSFRMTDIWRSYIAQRICWENDWYVAYCSPTVAQERNDHQLLDDFKQEVDGYLGNGDICSILQNCRLERGEDKIGSNLIKCYEALIARQFIGEEEIGLLESWISDVEGIVQ